MASQLCKNCAHFTNSGECKRFKYNDLVTGATRYHNAYTARYTQSMCGKQAVHYIEPCHEPYEIVKHVDALSAISRTNPSITDEKVGDVVVPIIICSAEGCNVVYNSGGFDDSHDIVYMGMEYADEVELNDVY